MELECESESSFKIKCTFQANSMEPLSISKWVYVHGDRLSGFMDDNTTGTGLFEVTSVVGMSSGNNYNRRAKFNQLTVWVRLSFSISFNWLLSTSLLLLLSLLIIITFLLPPNHANLQFLVMTLLFLLILLPSQLVSKINSFSSFGVPSQTRVYSLLFVIGSLILPLQDLFRSEKARELAPILLSIAERVPHFKTLHSTLLPYVEDYTLPFILVLLKVLISFIFTLLI
ncbi:hypothetical protein PFISCL1PPCAC_20724, partial [Pristionchus fissidentatus]